MIRELGLEGSSGWTPASLFHGTPGGFWDFRPPYVFQDSAGTIPADIGDPVGFVKDLSGNELPLSMNSSSFKPSLRVSGTGMPYAQFDGVDDYMLAYNFFDSANGGYQTPYTCVFSAAIYDNTDPSSNYIRDYVVGSQNAGSGNGLEIGHRDRDRVGIYQWGATESLYLTRNVQFGVVEVHTAINKYPGGEYRINGSLIGSSATAPSTNYVLANPLSIARAADSLVLTKCDVYSVVFIKRILSNAEIARLERWMAHRAGISL